MTLDEVGGGSPCGARRPPLEPGKPHGVDITGPAIVKWKRYERGIDFGGRRLGMSHSVPKDTAAGVDLCT
jgi:hypothetical protein